MVSPEPHWSGSRLCLNGPGHHVAAGNITNVCPLPRTAYTWMDIMKQNCSTSATWQTRLFVPWSIVRGALNDAFIFELIPGSLTSLLKARTSSSKPISNRRQPYILRHTIALPTRFRLPLSPTGNGKVEPDLPLSHNQSQKCTGGLLAKHMALRNSETTRSTWAIYGQPPIASVAQFQHLLKNRGPPISIRNPTPPPPPPPRFCCVTFCLFISARSMRREISICSFRKKRRSTGHLFLLVS